MAVSIRDVASRAGVSYTTVSKVLNERPGDRTAPETRRRVFEAARSLGYRPNAIARSLRSRRTDIIGLYTGFLLLDMTDPFQGVVLNGLQRGCEELNKDLLVHRKFDGYSAEDVFRDLSNHRVDGLVLAAGCDDAIVQRLTADAVPAVSLAYPDAALPSVFPDSADGFRRLADYLAGRGHRRILYRTTPISPLPQAAESRRRRLAFAQAANAHGIEVIVCETGVGGDVSAEEAALLLGPPAARPTAAACWNDRHAHRTLAFCRRHGLQAPGDLAVTGFDGFVSHVELPYALTTVAAPWEECARVSAGLVVAMTEGRTVLPETILPVALTLGDTA